MKDLAIARPGGGGSSRRSQNADGTDRWQYRPRVCVSYQLDSGWTFTLRADAPLRYINATGPGNPAAAAPAASARSWSRRSSTARRRP